jgi:anaerobic selenocysteine-containing dehydrogenase
MVTLTDGVITNIEGNPEAPTRGTMCSKGLSSIQHVDHPDRLRYPLKRAGKRGEGKWDRITWDEALDTIAGKMKESQAKYGPQSVAVSQGTGRGYNEYTHRFARSIGTANILTPGYVCHSPRLGLYGLVTGYGRLYCDYHGWGGEFPKTQISWAKQLEISSADGEMAVWFMNSLKHVKNLIVIDPRETALSSRATLWLQIRPGTDAALAMSMLNVIIKEQLWDKDFVDNWTYGFDKLAERVEAYTPEKAAEITWLKADDIRKAARLFAVDTPGCIQIGSSLERQANCGQTLRAIICLMGATGNIERPGSMVCWMPPSTGQREDFFNEIPITDEMRKGIVGAEKHKMGASRTAHSDSVIKELLSGNSTVKVWFSVGGQQIIHLANTKEVVPALNNLEFLAHADQFMGPMAEAADVVLPAAHWLELDDIYDMHPRFMIEAHNKVVDPPGEAKPDNWIFNELGKRLAPQHWFENVEKMLDWQLRKGNLTWKEFSKMGWLARTGKDQVYYKYKTDYWRKGGGFPTATGKFEFYSVKLEDLGYDPLPYFTEPGESPLSTPELAKEFPLVLTTGYRQPFYFLSQYRNIPWLRSFQKDPVMQIHPDTAAQYGIADGDWAWIESPRGKIKQRARLFPGILRGVVMATANCFYPEEPGPLHGLMKSNPNVLTSNNHVDPMYGSPDLTCLLCRVSKAEDGK